MATEPANLGEPKGSGLDTSWRDTLVRTGCAAVAWLVAIILSHFVGRAAFDRDLVLVCALLTLGVAWVGWLMVGLMVVLIFLPPHARGGVIRMLNTEAFLRVAAISLACYVLSAYGAMTTIARRRAHVAERQTPAAEAPAPAMPALIEQWERQDVQFYIATYEN